MINSLDENACKMVYNVGFDSCAHIWNKWIKKTCLNSWTCHVLSVMYNIACMHKKCDCVISVHFYGIYGNKHNAMPGFIHTRKQQAACITCSFSTVSLKFITWVSTSEKKII